MGKMYKTKCRILALLISERKTLTEICAEMKLSASTIHQHLKELRNMGAVYIVNDPYIKKWKYYDLSMDFDFSIFGIKQKLLDVAIGRQQSMIRNNSLMT